MSSIEKRWSLSDDDAFCNRDYVPIDILPSDVGGGKNAPSMASLIFGEISNNEMNLTSRTLLTLSSFSGQFVQCIGVEDDGRFLSGEKGVWFPQEVTPSLQIVNQSQHLGKIKFYK